jgi:hypothetical protein
MDIMKYFFEIISNAIKASQLASIGKTAEAKAAMLRGCAI